MEDTTTIRDSLESAIPENDVTEAAAPDPVVESEPQPELDLQPTESASEPTKSENRDTKGRFKSKETKPAAPTEAASEAIAEPTPSIRPGPKAEPKAAPQERAPASWRPDVREHWASLPAEVRAEVARREREMQTTLQETAEARRFSEQLGKVIAPYEAFIRAENSNALQAIDNLMGTAARLRTGTAPELAQLMAGMVKQFGVGRFGQPFIEALDSALVGEIPRVDPQQAQLQQAIQQQLAPVQQFMSQFQQAQVAQQQRAQEQAASEVSKFIERAEFGEDVREEMADVLEVAQRRGRELSLADAYRQACLVNPRVRSVLEARAKQKGVQQLTGAAQKAKAAAVSVSGGPAIGAPKQESADIRSAIEAAIAINAR
jgi:hypothetical protein